MDWRHFPPLAARFDSSELPPKTITDAAGRQIECRLFGTGPIDGEYEALVDMYLDFAPEHRSLGLPPIGERRIRDWLDVLLAGDSLLAWHDSRVIGQATLLESGEDECELTIFVHPTYHGNGIGTQMLRTLLSHGKDRGIRRVWLLVERANYNAVDVYHEVGFFVTESHGYDIEMAITL